jgi:hypothetical protein
MLGDPTLQAGAGGMPFCVTANLLADMRGLRGWDGIGHNWYPITGESRVKSYLQYSYSYDI